MNNRNSGIDLARYAASLMVVGIHTSLFREWPAEVHFWFVNVAFRLAVPFFVLCTGYFLTNKLEFSGTLADTGKNRRVFIRQWKKLIFHYGLWTLIYLVHAIPMWLRTGWFSPMAFVDYAVATLTVGSHYHLWYLWALIYTLPAFWLLLRKVPLSGLRMLALLLWAAEVVLYAYHRLLPAGWAAWVLKFDFLNSFLRILALLLTGAVICRDRRPSGPFDAVGFLCCFVLLGAEAFWLRSLGQSAVSYIVMTLPTAWFLFRLLPNVKTAECRIPASRLSAVGTTVYFAHPILVELPFTEGWSSISRFFFVAAGSTLLGFVYEMIRHTPTRKR